MVVLQACLGHFDLSPRRNPWAFSWEGALFFFRPRLSRVYARLNLTPTFSHPKILSTSLSKVCARTIYTKQKDKISKVTKENAALFNHCIFSSVVWRTKYCSLSITNFQAYHNTIATARAPNTVTPPTTRDNYKRLPITRTFKGNRKLRLVVLIWYNWQTTNNIVT